MKSVVYKKDLDLLSHVCAALPWIKDFLERIAFGYLYEAELIKSPKDDQALSHL